MGYAVISRDEDGTWFLARDDWWSLDPRDAIMFGSQDAAMDHAASLEDHWETVKCH